MNILYITNKFKIYGSITNINYELGPNRKH